MCHAPDPINGPLSLGPKLQAGATTKEGHPDSCANNAAAAPPSAHPSSRPRRASRARRGPRAGRGGPRRSEPRWQDQGVGPASSARRREPLRGGGPGADSAGQRRQGPSVRDAHASGSTEAQCAPLCTPGGAQSAEARRGRELDEALREHVAFMELALMDPHDGEDLVVDTIGSSHLAVPTCRYRRSLRAQRATRRCQELFCTATSMHAWKQSSQRSHRR